MRHGHESGKPRHLVDEFRGEMEMARRTRGVSYPRRRFTLASSRSGVAAPRPRHNPAAQSHLVPQS